MRRSVQSYEDLEVWQRGMDLADEVYRLTRSFPSEEKFGLVSQLRRAAVSIPSNIAEGWGRGSTSEYLQFLRYARGSLYEIETNSGSRSAKDSSVKMTLARRLRARLP